uniref:E3 ubiquitin-protein ligase n=1 Tax=Timema poppense TaxID=170557 RepID=A0A7R9H283_TIMPO|nr:unnamed protein product [Timema poppensis]
MLLGHPPVPLRDMLLGPFSVPLRHMLLGPSSQPFFYPYPHPHDQRYRCLTTNADKNFHYVVDCGRQVMKEHCYWPLVSDLNNVLSHRPVAVKFMSDDNLLEMWFTFLAMFQGMNVNQREMTQHVEFEPNTYYAAFSAELEASAYPMWALVSHLTDSSSIDLTKRVLTSCLIALQDWLDAINFTHPHMNDSMQVSFHLPLHRYFSVFMCQAIKQQGLSLQEILPPRDVLTLIMMHPLRVQMVAV